MDNRDKERIVRTLVDIIVHASPAGAKAERRHRGIGLEHVSFCLLDDCADRYDELVTTTLRKRGWADKYSEKYLEGAFDQIIAGALAEGTVEGVGNSVDQLVAAYEAYSQERVVCVPLTGLRLPIGNVPIGRVVLKEMAGDVLQALESVLERIVAQKPSPEDVKPAILQHHREVLHTLKGKVCAEFHIVAEPQRALELAEHETRRVVELLRYAIPALDEYRLHPQVGLEGEALTRAIRTAVVMSSEGTEYSYRQGLAGPYASLELNDANLEVMRRIGVFDVSELLQKPKCQLTDIERGIIRGVHWMADAVCQPQPENALLSLITCLETYLTREGHDPISSSVAEGVAIALGRDLESRKKLKRKVKEFYRKRSTISHGGDSAVLKLELDALSEIVGSMTMWMIRHHNQWATRVQLLEWIEDQKLAGPCTDGDPARPRSTKV